MHHTIPSPRACAVRTPLGLERRERGVRAVVALTFVMMVMEIAAGYVTGSMALLADGWHMATHVAALGLASAAYALARRYAGHRAFAFGTGKVHALAGYTSAVALGLVALVMLAESVSRLLEPAVIDFATSLPVAVLGLVVNLASMRLLHAGQAPEASAPGAQGTPASAGHDHEHTHPHAAADEHAEHEHAHEHEHAAHEHEHAAHEHEHAAHEHDAEATRAHHPAHAPHHAHAHGHDHNHRAALLHVAADALTSLLAIIALLAGRFGGHTWLDPVMGIVGAAVILKWGVGLCRHAAFELLDVELSPALEEDIRASLERIDDVVVSDLHVWSLGRGARGCIVSLISSVPRDPEHYRRQLARFALAHLTVEVHRCDHDHDHAPASVGPGALPLLAQRA